MSSFQRAQKIYDAIWQYSSDDVSPDTVRRLISMAVMAPLAHNRQPWPFVVSRAESRTRQTRQRISSAHWRSPDSSMENPPSFPNDLGTLPIPDRPKRMHRRTYERLCRASRDMKRSLCRNFCSCSSLIVQCGIKCKNRCCTASKLLVVVNKTVTPKRQNIGAACPGFCGAGTTLVINYFATLASQH
jgi:nitroreductase